MLTSIPITDISIITVDQSDTTWTIEGEVTFDENFSVPFEAYYNSYLEDFEELTLDTTPSSLNEDELKYAILKAVEEFN